MKYGQYYDEYPLAASPYRGIYMWNPERSESSTEPLGKQCLPTLDPSNNAHNLDIYVHYKLLPSNNYDLTTIAIGNNFYECFIIMENIQVSYKIFKC